MSVLTFSSFQVEKINLELEGILDRPGVICGESRFEGLKIRGN